VPRLEANASWARSRSMCARCDSSIGPSLAVVISVRAMSNVPACTLAKAASSARWNSSPRIRGQLGRAGEEGGGG
jgi:hypothetical protein